MRHDYISPGLTRIDLRGCFPHMVADDPSASGWEFLRQEVPHRWYRDQRTVPIGFVSLDEAHVLYNSALQFPGQSALEIGCWLGWSACHLARAGVLLDVVDPILERSDFLESVTQALQAAGVLNNVRLVAGYSPQRVHELSQGGRKRWSLLFIDGNHDAPYPLHDAMACEPLAAQDALVLFHDLNSPAVSQGLDYFRERGWNTMIYQTMQIMGVAWRGAAVPVRHYPDPSVIWSLPAHLSQHPVCGWTPAYDPLSAREDLLKWQAALSPLAKLTAESWTTLYTLARTQCTADGPGNFVACGGDSTAVASLLARVIKAYSLHPRVAYVCPGEEAATQQNRPGTIAPAGLAELCRRWDVVDTMAEVTGLISPTVPVSGVDVGPLSLVHLQLESYQATSAALDRLYDALCAESVVIVSDYSRAAGAKAALDDFQIRRGLRFDLNPSSQAGVWFRKAP